LAGVQQDKTASDTEASRAKASTDRAELLQTDARERQKVALDAWIQAYKTAAQFNVPLPPLSEFQAAMASKVPPIAMLSGAPPPAQSAQPPATSQSAQPPPQPQPRPMGMPQQGRPMVPPTPPASPPRGAMPPAAQVAQQQALRGAPMPNTAYGQIAQRAALGAVFGPGGPSIPTPGGQPAG